jgi:hypothetical protein
MIHTIYESDKERARKRQTGRRDGTHLDGITWWGKYDLIPIPSPTQTMDSHMSTHAEHWGRGGGEGRGERASDARWCN